MALSCKPHFENLAYKTLLSWSIVTWCHWHLAPTSMVWQTLTNGSDQLEWYRVFEISSLRKNTGLRHLNTEFKSSNRYQFAVYSTQCSKFEFLVDKLCVFNVQNLYYKWFKLTKDLICWMRKQAFGLTHFYNILFDLHQKALNSSLQS